MQISAHYGAFPVKTAIVVTNHERARIFAAEGREVDEVEVLHAPEVAHNERASGAGAKTDQSFDSDKAHNLEELYASLNVRLTEMVRNEGYHSIIACVPEINKNMLVGKLEADVQKHIASVVPKNLANMEAPVIMRILLEG